MSEALNFSLNMRKVVKFRNLRQKHDGEPDTIEICKYGEDAHYSALQYLQIIERKWFNRFHSRDRQLCKFMGTKEKVTSEKSSNPKALTWSTNLGIGGWDIPSPLCFTGIRGISFYPTLISYPHLPWPSVFSCTVGSGYEI